MLGVDWRFKAHQPSRPVVKMLYYFLLKQTNNNKKPIENIGFIIEEDFSCFFGFTHEPRSCSVMLYIYIYIFVFLRSQVERFPLAKRLCATAKRALFPKWGIFFRATSTVRLLPISGSCYFKHQEEILLSVIVPWAKWLFQSRGTFSKHFSESQHI